MEQEKRICQNCQQGFIIEPEDFQFYEKVGVPPPTFCPQCRIQRRLTWRNERTLYRGQCAATDKKFLTMFSPESNVTVYDRDYWWSDKWDQLKSGQQYDFSKSFFQQFFELLHRAPLPNLANTNVVKSEYGNHNANCKNCYLVYASFDNENVSYASGILSCRDSMDMYISEKVEKCYEVSFSGTLNRVLFSYDADDSLDSALLRSCKNLNNCLGCVNLRNKSFYIWNKPYSKEEFKKAREEFDFGSYKKTRDLKERFKKFSTSYPRRFASILKSVNSTGDMLMSTKNSKFCFDVYGDVEDSKYVIHATALKDSYDLYGAGAHVEMFYEGVDSGIDGMRCKFTVYAHECNDIQYAYCCHGSSNLFGCVGLRSKQYCILNRQYSKEEYEQLVPKIIQHMKDMPYVDSKGRRYEYGEFFPEQLSPFAYNETIAQEYYPLTQSQALEQGYAWKKQEEKDYEITIQTGDLPDHIRDVKDEILSEVIGCDHAIGHPPTGGGGCVHQCMTAFKITPEELQFYRQHTLALPRICSNCRHYERLGQRNPFKLWTRQCMCLSAEVLTKVDAYKNAITHSHGRERCFNTFETPYSPEGSDVVYCETCYQTEVI